MMAAPFQQGLGDWTLSFNVQSIQVRRNRSALWQARPGVISALIADIGVVSAGLDQLPAPDRRATKPLIYGAVEDPLLESYSQTTVAAIVSCRATEGAPIPCR